MPAVRFLTIVLPAVLLMILAVLLMILKEAGPEIFVQSQPLIIPSGSLELLPSSETLSVGKVITWSGPAIEFIISFYFHNLSMNILFTGNINR
jgi:hypothetical protein